MTQVEARLTALAGSEVSRFDEYAPRTGFSFDAAPVVVRVSVSAAQLVRCADTGQRGRVARPSTFDAHRCRRCLVHHTPLSDLTLQLVTRQAR